jgi:acid phosphatase family membrane protein YuiD
MASSISHIPAVVSSPALIAALLSFSIAQTAKVFTHYHATGKVDYTRLVGSGGMPSSHTALVVGLCTSIGLKEGMQSSIFALCLVFSLVVRVCVCARARGLSARGSRELALSRGSRVRSRCVDAWGMKARAVWVWHRLRLLLLRDSRAGG